MSLFDTTRHVSARQLGMNRAPGVEVRFRLPYLRYPMGLLVVLQLAVPNKGWMVLLARLVGTWLLSYLWARCLARGLASRREMRCGWAQAGDPNQERFELSNAGWAAATWVQAADHSDLPCCRAGNVVGLGA